MVVDFVWSTNLLESSLVHYHDTVRHIYSLLLIVCNIDKGNSQLLLQSLQFQLHRPSKLQIQSSERLVQKQYTGIICQCSCNGYTLLLSTGELRRFSFLEAFQLNQLQHFLNLFLYIRFWYFSYFQTIPDVIRHVHMGKKGIILKYRVHISLVWLQIRHIFPLQPYTSAVRLLKSCDDAKSGRLAAAGSTQQGDEFPLINLQIDSL